MLVVVLVSSLVTVAGIVLVLMRQMALQQSTVERFTATERSQERVERGLREELARGRDETLLSARQIREDVRIALTDLATRLQARVTEAGEHQRERIDGFATTLKLVTTTLEQQLATLGKTIDERLQALQADNGQRLEQMRATVDEKLQGTPFLSIMEGDCLECVSGYE